MAKLVACDRQGQSLTNWIGSAQPQDLQALKTALGIQAAGTVEIKTQDSDNVTLTGNGTDGEKLTATVKVDPAPGNRITSSAAGLKVVAELPELPQDGKEYLLRVTPAGQVEWISTDAFTDSIACT